MPRRRRFSTPALTCVVVTMVLSGCITGSATGPTPSATGVTPSPSPSATSAEPTAAATPTPPIRPAAMGTNDEAGAVAAAEYFLSDLYDYMYTSGDTAEWAALAADDCSFCNSVLSDVQGMAAAGQSDSGSDVRITYSRAAWVTAGELYSVWLSGTQAASERRDATGEVVSTGEGGPFDLFLAVGWSDGWVIRAVDVINT